MFRYLLVFSTFSLLLADKTPICLNGFQLVNNKCLRLFTSLVDHKAAEKTCHSYHANLATVRNGIDNRALASLVGSAAVHIWLGLYCFENDPNRCLWDDADGSAIEYSNFARSFPYVDIGNCVYYSVSGSLAGQWVSAECDNELSAFVCEAPPTYQDSCSYNFNGFCYLLLNNYQTLNSAQQHCEAYSSELLSVHSTLEMRYVSNVFSSTTGVPLNAIVLSPTSFFWFDGTPWDYSNFMDGTSTTLKAGQCLRMQLAASTTRFAGEWYAASCDEATNYYVCKRPAGGEQSTTPEPVTDTSEPGTNQCGSTIQAPGRITSPNYPGQYPNNLYCTYLLTALGGNFISLRFEAFATESNYDYVDIYDGASNSSTHITRITGAQTVPFTYSSTTNNMFLVFKTDVSNTNYGFTAVFSSKWQ